MNLTPDQIQSIDNGDPVRIIVDGRSCVLVSNSTYTQLQELIDQWHPATMHRNLSDVMADEWNDPAKSIYDEP